MIAWKKQLMFGCLLILMAVIYIWLIPYQTSSEPIVGAGGRDRINGGFFPYISGIFFLITSIMFINSKHKKRFEEQTSPIMLKELVYAAIFVVIGLIYICALQKIGYILATIVLLFCLIFKLKSPESKKYTLFVFPIVATFVVYFVFTKLFYVSLP